MSGASFITVFKLLFALNDLLVDCKLVIFSANMSSLASILLQQYY